MVITGVDWLRESRVISFKNVLLQILWGSYKSTNLRSLLKDVAVRKPEPVQSGKINGNYFGIDLLKLLM
jgi:hypothetical protein